MTLPRGESGFTLVELLVAMAMAVVVFGATLTALDFFQNHNRVDILRNEAQDYARNAVDRLAREIRNVAAPKGAVELPGALEQAEEYSIVFQTIDPTAGKSENASHAMRVRYCLEYETNAVDKTDPSHEILWRQVKRWTTAAAPALPPAGAPCPESLAEKHWESSSQLVQHLTNNQDSKQKRPLFVYGPLGWSEVSQIVTVEPNLFLNVNPGNHPGETQLNSAISLRNANRAPIATFTAKELNGHVQLNASESVDPDGLALTYSWTEGKEVAGKEEGETVIASTGQQYETPGKLISKSVYKYWLRVTDPGGLTASTKREVTIN
jgi:prepilin-type N-terminal cleavage/methylation domain-containing protein